VTRGINRPGEDALGHASDGSGPWCGDARGLEFKYAAQPEGLGSAELAVVAAFGRRVDAQWQDAPLEELAHLAIGHTQASAQLAHAHGLSFGHGLSISRLTAPCLLPTARIKRPLISRS
jgi:hypothetical protein